MEITRALNEIKAHFEENADRLEKEANKQKGFASQIAMMLEGQVAERKPSPIDDLTEAEALVFRHIGDGKGTGDIETLLNVKRKTVQTHMRNISIKIGAKNVHELRAFATRFFNT